MNLLKGAVGLSVILLPFSSVAAPISVKDKLEKLDQKQRVLERKLELQEEKEKSGDNAKVTASKEGFAIKSGDGSFQLKLKGLIHADGRFLLQLPANQGQTTFLARRVRPILEGNVYKNFSFRIMPDFGSGTAVLNDAYIDAAIKPYLKIRVGRFKVPVGLERLQSINDIALSEFAYPTALVPNRDLGLQVFGEINDGIVSYALGVFDGVADGASGDADLNDGKDIVGRVFVKPFSKTSIAPLKGLGFGVGGSWGKQNGTTSSTALPSYRSPGQLTVFRYTSDTSVTPNNITVSNRTAYRLAPQLYYNWGIFGVSAEYTRSTVHVTNNNGSAALTHQAWQVTPSVVLTGEKATDKSLKPKRPINPAKGHWGALELVGRYQELKLDQDTFPNFSSRTSSISSAKTFGGGVNWYLNDNVKVVTDYQRSLFKDGSAVGNRATENVITSRVQFAF